MGDPPPEMWIQRGDRLPDLLEGDRALLDGVRGSNNAT